MANPVCSNLQRLSRKMKKEAHKGLLFHFAEREGFSTQKLLGNDP
jgi:hypothetical protein